MRITREEAVALVGERIVSNIRGDGSQWWAPVADTKELHIEVDGRKQSYFLEDIAN